jgi:hypothetical protein
MSELDKSHMGDIGIIADRETAAALTELLARDGWRVTYIPVDTTPTSSADAHALSLVALPPDAADAWLARRHGRAAQATPVIVALPPDGAVDIWTWVRRGWDDAATHDDLAAVAARWRPPACSLARLEGVFGVTEVAQLSLGLRERLAAAVAMLRAFDPGDRATLAETAHRLAGICGILGFDDAGRCWRALAEARDIPLPDVHRATRLAIAAIDRHYAGG